MDDPNRSRRDGPLRFRLRERDRYLKEFALEIRSKSRFAEQMIKGVHQAPARVVDDDDEDVQEDQFVQRRLENSTRGSLEMSSDDGTPSSGAEELSQEEQLELERAIQAAVRLAVKTTAQHKTKETGAATAPAAAAEGVLDIERAAADATAGGLGSDARPTSGGGMEGQATPPVFNDLCQVPPRTLTATGLFRRHSRPPPRRAGRRRPLGSFHSLLLQPRATCPTRGVLLIDGKP